MYFCASSSGSGMVVNDNDLSLVERAVDEHFPTLYRGMLRLPLNERPDDLRISDYCF